MATEDRATGQQTPKRRGKSPTITLEATEIPVETKAETVPDPIPGDTSATPEAEAVVTPAEAIPANEAASEVEALEPSTEPAAATLSKPSPEDPAPSPEPVTPPSEAAPPTAHAEPAEPAAPSAAEPRASEGPGFGRLAAAGLIGALITGGFAVGAQVAGLVPAPNRTVSPDVQNRLAAMDQALKDLAARPVPPTGSPAPAVDLAPLRRQIETAVTGLEQRLKTLEESRPATPGDGTTTPPPDLAPLLREIESLKASVATLDQARPETPAPAVDMAAIEAQTRAALQPLGSRLDALEARLQASGTESKGLGDSLQALGTRIATIEATRTEGDAMGRRAALIVGLQLLRSAVERGAPFVAELTAARALGAEAAGLQPLEAAASAGLPTRAQLAQRFTALAPALMRAAPQAPAAGGGLIDRLAASAQGLVRVRPVGETAGDDAGATIARAEAKLARGDLAGALADVEKLPAPVLAAAKDWVAEARARLAADNALQGLTSQALAALGSR